MVKQTLNIGLIGHKFMGKAHSNALKNLNMFFEPGAMVNMKTICGVEDDIAEAAARYGWKSYETDWHKVVEDPEIDIIDICTPGLSHCEIALAAAKAGKHIICEKPLSMTAAEAGSMYASAVEQGIRHMVNFCYRRVPAVALAKEIISSSRLGEIYHFHAIYQQDWVDESTPYVWRFDKKIAGAGAISDKGSHVIDLARYLVGELKEVVGMTDIFLAEHQDPVSGDMKPVTTDDAAMFLARFENGATGNFETSRISTGYKNALRFAVTGSKGSLRFNLERLNELEVYFADEDKTTQGFRTVLVTDAQHPYVNHWWPQGHIIGWEHLFVHQYYEFVRAIVENKAVQPDFYDGLINMQIIEAIERSARERCWVTL